jgi:hypothetical protein
MGVGMPSIRPGVIAPRPPAYIAGQVDELRKMALGLSETARHVYVRLLGEHPLKSCEVSDRQPNTEPTIGDELDVVRSDLAYVGSLLNEVAKSVSRG